MADRQAQTQRPLLTAVGALLMPASVLELGCGPVSTALFLDAQHFPALRHLRSWDNTRWWFEQVRDEVRDERADLRFYEGELAAGVASGAICLSGYDVVFIDDGRGLGDRAATIRAVTEKAPRSAVILVHDFEHEAYRQALGTAHAFSLDCLRPELGVGWWTETAITAAQLAALNRALRTAIEEGHRG